MDLAQFSNAVASWQQRLTTSVLPGLETKLGQTLLQHFTETFREGGYEKGSSFVPWARRKYSYPTPVLQKTGRLLHSFRVEKGRGRVEIVNDAPYAEYIQEGTDQMPARPLVYDSEKVEREVEQLITKELEKLFRF